jgi:hypothetical protein
LYLENKPDGADEEYTDKYDGKPMLVPKSIDPFPWLRTVRPVGAGIIIFFLLDIFVVELVHNRVLITQN